MTHHEASLDHPERVRADGARGAGSHRGQDVQRPWVLAHGGLVTLDLRRGVEPLGGHRRRERRRGLTKLSLDAVVHREVNGPGGQIAQDGGPEAAVEAAEAILLKDVPDRVWTVGRIKARDVREVHVRKSMAGRK